MRGARIGVDSFSAHAFQALSLKSRLRFVVLDRDVHSIDGFGWVRNGRTSLLSDSQRLLMQPEPLLRTPLPAEF